MSFKRKQVDRKKSNNLVAKHDYNVGGVHKSAKQRRHNTRVKFSQIDPNDYDTLDELQEQMENE